MFSICSCVSCYFQSTEDFCLLSNRKGGNRAQISEFFSDCDSTEGTNHLWAWSVPVNVSSSRSQHPTGPTNDSDEEKQPTSEIVGKDLSGCKQLLTLESDNNNNKHQTYFKSSCYQSHGAMEDVHLWTTATAIKINIWEPREPHVTFSHEASMLTQDTYV